MKFFAPSTTVLFLLQFTTAAAVENPADLLVEKRKTYSKSYSISTADRISLNNQFGEMKIQTWNKNEVKADVIIVAKGSTDDIAQKILDRITIEDGKSGNGVWFNTKIRDMNENWNKGKKKEYREQSMKIDYMVYLPAGNSLEAMNQFGPLSIPDYSGPVDLESKFGSLTAGRLEKPKEISVEFGEARIESINGGKFTIKFSKGEVKSISGTVSVNVEFCDKIKIGMSNSMKDLNLRTSYSTVYLDALSTLSASFDIHTNFGEFKNKTAFSIPEEKDGDDRYGPKFDKNFRGTAGGGSNRIKIKSEFGEVVLGHNLQVDFSEKKDKTKSNAKVI
jgi:hypothetical protein